MRSKIGKGDFMLRRKLLIQSVQLSGDTQDLERNSGRTLSLALGFVSKCLSESNTWHTPKDHFKFGDRNLLAMIFNVVEELNLEGFYYKKSDNTIMFDLKMEIPQNDRVDGLIRLGD